MGHKNIKTTETYLDSLSDDELIENVSRLLEDKHCRID